MQNYEIMKHISRIQNKALIVYEHASKPLGIKAFVRSLHTLVEAKLPERSKEDGIYMKPDT